MNVESKRWVVTITSSVLIISLVWFFIHSFIHSFIPVAVEDGERRGVGADSETGGEYSAEPSPGYDSCFNVIILLS